MRKLALFRLCFVYSLFSAFPSFGSIPPAGFEKDTSLTCPKLQKLVSWVHTKSIYAKEKKLRSKQTALAVMKKFVDIADPLKLILLQKEAERFEQQGMDQWENFLKGNCSLFDSFILDRLPTYIARLKKKAAENNFDASVKSANFEDLKKRVRAADDHAHTLRVQQWKKYLSENSSSFIAQAYGRDWNQVAVAALESEGYSNPPSRDWAAKAVLETLDPYAAYFSHSEYEMFSANLAGGISGVGIDVSKAPQGLLIERIMDASPERGTDKLKPGDIITHIDGKELRSISDHRISTGFLSGIAGSVVHLALMSLSDSSTRKLDVKRGDLRFDEEEMNYSIYTSPDQKPYAVIRLPYFYGPTDSNPEANGVSDDFKKILVELHENYSDKIPVLIDLRGNPGGFLRESIEIAAMLVGHHPITSEWGDDEVDIKRADNVTVFHNGPIGILQDGSTASAAEVLTAAVRDYQRGVVLGTGPSLGKGSVQRIYPLNDPSVFENFQSSGEGVVKFTTSIYFSPRGYSPNEAGNLPDISISDSKASMDEPLYRGLPQGVPARVSSLSGREERKLAEREKRFVSAIRSVDSSHSVSFTSKNLAKLALDPTLKKALSLFAQYSTKTPQEFHRPFRTVVR